MEFFSYIQSVNNKEYYEILETLMLRWECEVVEFKEAKGQYDTDKIGRYFSAISNEANLRSQQYGWLVFGVSEQKEKHIVGTAYKQGDRSIIEKFKYEKEIKELLWNKLPDSLSDNQKDNKIKNLLTTLRSAGKICTDSDNQQTSNWKLK